MLRQLKLIDDSTILALTYTIVAKNQTFRSMGHMTRLILIKIEWYFEESVSQYKFGIQPIRMPYQNRRRGIQTNTDVQTKWTNKS